VFWDFLGFYGLGRLACGASPPRVWRRSRFGETEGIGVCRARGLVPPGPET